jgi:type IV secretory pathway VirB4 component
MNIRIPGDFDISLKLFGRFSLKDVFRLFAPPLLGLAFTNIVLIAVGAVIGLVWQFWRPYDRTLESHLYHSIKWLTGKRRLDQSDIGEFESRFLTDGVDKETIATRDGTFAAVIKVEPTNLDLKTDAEKAAIHSIYQNLLETVTYPLQIYSRQEPLELDDYIKNVAEKDVNDEVLKKDYGEFCIGFTEKELTQTHHYIVLHVDSGEHTLYKRLDEYSDRLPILEGIKDRLTSPKEKEDAAASELDSRCREVIDAIDTTDISAERLTDEELSEFARKANNRDPDPTPTWTAQNSEYHRTIAIEEYPTTVDLAWPLQILRTQGRTDVVQVIEPRNPGKTAKKLQRLSEKLNAEINSLLAGGYRGTNKLESLLEDTEWFLDLLADREAQPVEYSCYIDVHHEEKERCLNTYNQVCNRLNTVGFEYSQPVLQTHQAFYVASPLYEHDLGNSLLVPATSAAAGFPFATQDTEDTGLIYGSDVYDGTPILLDRFQWSSHSMARMGMVGSGKSYAAKIELLRAALIYDDLEIIVVDPKQEYKRVIQTLDGEVQQLEEGTDYSFDNDVTGFTVEERGQRDNVELLTEAVEQIYNHVSQDKKKTLVLVDEARILLNDDEGRRILNQFVLEGRDTNTAITLVTQNASHFTHSREGREILDNMPGKIFMRHDRVPDSVVDYFDFSQREKQELFELNTGTDSDYSEALIRVSGRINARVGIESTPQEHALIESGGEQ